MALKLAVFGNPIAHSMSPLIHQHFAKLHGHEISYERLLVEGSFKEAADAFFSSGGLGCNITVPCKIEAYEFAHELTDRARIAKAVNTLKRIQSEDGNERYIGDNTDGFGFYSDLLRLNAPLQQAKVLVIGAGGAARGILPSLMSKEAALSELTLVNRTVSKASQLLQGLDEVLLDRSEAKCRACTFDDLLPDDHYDVIINSTSLSVSKELPKIPDSIYTHAAFAYDLYYTKTGSTVFTDKASSLGVKACFDGLGMLVGQATLSYELWTGVRPDIGATLDYLRSELS